jgi:hypothetical protein
MESGTWDAFRSRKTAAAEQAAKCPSRGFGGGLYRCGKII